MYKIFRLDITMSVKLISIYPSHPSKGDLTKAHHKAQPPLEVSTPSHCSHQMILPSLSTSKNPVKSPQNSQVTFPQPLSVVDL